MKIIVINETSESILGPSVKGKFGAILLQFELPKEQEGFQQYQRALKHPQGIKQLAHFCDTHGIQEPPMETHTPEQTEQAKGKK